MNDEDFVIKSLTNKFIYIYLFISILFFFEVLVAFVCKFFVFSSKICLREKFAAKTV